ncbi:5-formyltetrahydrofolate cyclo-ligase [Metabacillus sp. GX 13764]|uniref:5-formyltetrahydrofolate cyclo-ligase n=1 Tax=Metabacillus kandeliae TaxID=2900151 RepID=UPI001E58FE23|nr:5-formyltetrahydrofolate cyclo-ligase [Metabacillus kandeliae]MCD7033107.1 5-formyltetrahydrofolate cyclo-ligase [Metabacillus kandeliae]
MNKEAYRKLMKEKLSRIDEEDFKQLCRQIHTNTLSLREWDEARIIGITISAGREIDTEPLIRAMWEQGKRVAVPKCIPKTKEMIFHSITSYSQLETVYFGLMEPVPEKTELVRKDEIDLAVIPGLIFDKRGYRIGFGGGYYDRWLSDYSGESISLALQMQVGEKIPKESFDLPVKKIITESEVILTSDGTLF